MVLTEKDLSELGDTIQRVRSLVAELLATSVAAQDLVFALSFIGAELGLTRGTDPLIVYSDVLDAAITASLRHRRLLQHGGTIDEDAGDDGNQLRDKSLH